MEVIYSVLFFFVECLVVFIQRMVGWSQFGVERRNIYCGEFVSFIRFKALVINFILYVVNNYLIIFLYFLEVVDIVKVMVYGRMVGGQFILSVEILDCFIFIQFYLDVNFQGLEVYC